MIQHPIISQIERYGYPDDFREPDPYICPVCGREVEEYIYRDRDGDTVGCDSCISTISIIEL